jgi:hypothetical protein
MPACECNRDDLCKHREQCGIDTWLWVHEHGVTIYVCKDCFDAIMKDDPSLGVSELYGQEAIF